MGVTLDVRLTGDMAVGSRVPFVHLVRKFTKRNFPKYKIRSYYSICCFPFQRDI